MIFINPSFPLQNFINDDASFFFDKKLESLPSELPDLDESLSATELYFKYFGNVEKVKND